MYEDYAKKSKQIYLRKNKSREKFSEIYIYYDHIFWEILSIAYLRISKMLLFFSILSRLVQLYLKFLHIAVIFSFRYHH